MPLVEPAAGDEVGSPAADSGNRTPAVPRSSDARCRRWGRHHRHDRHLRDLLSGSQRLTLLGLVLSWALCTLWAVLWWMEPGHRTSTLGMVLNSLLVSIEFVVLPIYLYWWLWRMRGPDPALRVPRLRTAMIVTKAPSEPWAVVRTTLEAMLAQDFPHPYDVWLADERVAPETRAWCRQRGVRICTRDGVKGYHRPSWPRRTRCKEGNLAFFYEIWGYRLYEVVAQLDADHVPAPGYLRRMVTPFVDEHVGYVAAPSICDRNADRSWSARARLYAEAVLHGPMQAGHSGGFAPSCIGSHYAVRTTALKQIGGIGPELAEDFTTTLMMSSHGWQGVFAIEAEAHGDGPECLQDCLTQEFQWSRSMMNVLLSITGEYWKELSVRAKLRLGFCQVWYPLFGLLMLLSVLLPLVAVLTRTPLMQVGIGAFYLHVAPAMLVFVATVLWLRSLDFLRPRAAKAVSWEIVLFQLIRWPWALLGCLNAIAGRIVGREFAFKVTPKGRTGVLPLPAKVVATYLFLAVISAAPTLLNLDAGVAHGYKTLALINAGLYLLAAIAIVAVHVREHPPGTRHSALRSITSQALATAACATFLPASLALQTFGGHDTRPANGTTIDRPPLRLGVTTRSLAENLTTAWTPADLDEVNAFERMTRAHAGIIQWFADWRHGRVDIAQLRAIADRGSTPQITWEPWDGTRAASRQPAYTLASIIRGRHDTYIRSWARDLRRYGGPVLLRFAQEMNTVVSHETSGAVYPWAEAHNGNRPGEYARAWRHVHDIFTAEGATNVRWVWCPVDGTIVPGQYPGDRYVDIVALSGFNGGTTLPWGGWRTFADVFDAPLRSLHRLAPDKLVQLSEVATAQRGGSKPLWIKQMFDYLETHASIRSVIWFELPKQTIDWRVATSPAAQHTFANRIGQIPGTTAPSGRALGARQDSNGRP